MKNEKITAGLLFLRVLKLLFYLQMGLLLEILSIRIKTFSMSRVRPLDITAKHVSFRRLVRSTRSWNRITENGNRKVQNMWYEPDTSVSKDTAMRLNDIDRRGVCQPGHAFEALDNLHTKKIEERGHFRLNYDFDFTLFNNPVTHHSYSVERRLYKTSMKFLFPFNPFYWNLKHARRNVRMFE